MVYRRPYNMPQQDTTKLPHPYFSLHFLLKEHYGMDSMPEAPTQGLEMDIALAALFKGLPSFNAEELDTARSFSHPNW